jgi:hypothetical protein
MSSASETVYGYGTVTARNTGPGSDIIYDLSWGNRVLTGFTRNQISKLTLVDQGDGRQNLSLDGHDLVTLSNEYAEEYMNNLQQSADTATEKLAATGNIQPDSSSSTATEINFPTEQTNADGSKTITASNGTSVTTPTPSANGQPIINKPSSETKTEEKYANPSNIDETVTATADSADQPPKESSTSEATPSPKTVNPKPATATFGGRDQRARLKVPSYYLKEMSTLSKTAGSVLTNNSGIVFPYTPQIMLEHFANYTTFNAMHSNYTQYFYKNSSVGEISLTAPFSVQNDNEAGILLGIIHLLRGLTKMKFGSDQNSGSPPPVCRLYAYGDYMLDNVPVVIKNFNLELPNNVDYFTCSNNHGFGISSVPVYSSIKLILLPMYSRQEMLNGTVEGWFSGQRKEGYL